MRNETNENRVIEMEKPSIKSIAIYSAKAVLAIVGMYLFCLLIGEEADGVHFTFIGWCAFKGAVLLAMYILYLIFDWLDRK